MSSAALVLAARTNGAKSQGPKTSEGKRRSAANSRTHGLYSAKITPDTEAEAEFRELLPTLIAEYQPVTPIQRRIIESLARAVAGIHWTWRLTQSVFDRGVLDHPDQSQPVQARVFDVFGSQANLLARIDTLERRFTNEWRAAIALLENRPKQLTPEPETVEASPIGPPAEIQKLGERTGSAALITAPIEPPARLKKFGERTGCPHPDKDILPVNLKLSPHENWRYRLPGQQPRSRCLVHSHRESGCAGGICLARCHQPFRL